MHTPESRFHITVECPTLNTLWTELETHLQGIYPTPLTNYEKAFGLTGTNSGIILRNWMTFLFRQCIMEQENLAYHNKKGKGNLIDLKIKYNQKIKTEIFLKHNIFINLGRADQFARDFAINNYLIEWQNEEWQVLTVFKTK